MDKQFGSVFLSPHTFEHERTHRHLYIQWPYVHTYVHLPTHKYSLPHLPTYLYTRSLSEIAKVYCTYELPLTKSNLSRSLIARLSMHNAQYR